MRVRKSEHIAFRLEKIERIKIIMMKKEKHLFIFIFVAYYSFHMMGEGR